MVPLPRVPEMGGSSHWCSAARAATGFTASLRDTLFAHIQTLSYADLDRVGTPTLLTRLTSDMNQVQNGLNLTLRLLLFLLVLPYDK